MAFYSEMTIESNKNSIKHSDHYQHGIALHYFTKDAVAWRAYHEYMINEVYTPLGITPHRGEARGGEFGNPRLTMTYKGLVKKLEKFDYRIPCSLNLITILPEYVKDKMVNNYLSNTSISTGINPYNEVKGIKNDNTWDASTDFFIKDDVVPFNFEYFCKIAAKLQEFTGALYGYYIRQPNDCDPIMYVSGINDYHSTTKEEYERNIKWGNLKFDLKQELEKYLRDIYKINFLSEFHLELKVDGDVTLRQWIETGPTNQRGSLHKLSEGFYAWYIEDETLIPKIRNQLAPSGIIICV